MLFDFDEINSTLLDFDFFFWISTWTAFLIMDSDNSSTSASVLSLQIFYYTPFSLSVTDRQLLLTLGLCFGLIFRFMLWILIRIYRLLLPIIDFVCVFSFY